MTNNAASVDSHVGFPLCKVKHTGDAKLNVSFTTIEFKRCPKKH
jgi:hypothetical protein